MTPEESMDVLHTINDAYPKFNLTTRKAKALLPNLQKMNYKGVMEKLGDHITHHMYPPTLSEIAVYNDVPEEKSPETPAFEDVHSWREQARHVPEELKQYFQKRMEELYREKGWLEE